MILQKIIYRAHYNVRKPTYIETRHIPFEEFVENVTAEACIIDSTDGFEVISISYSDHNTAVITYRQLEESENE